MGKIVLITGGARSGKSGYAMQCTSGCAKKGYIATACAMDEEMAQRIAKHRRERGVEFITVEETRHLAKALGYLLPRVDVIVIDCLTVWLGNLFHFYGEKLDDFSEIDDFFQAIERPRCNIFIVSNEVGGGIVPDNALARRFRDCAGLLNQRTARAADALVCMVCGYPIYVKGGLGE